MQMHIYRRNGSLTLSLLAILVIPAVFCCICSAFCAAFAAEPDKMYADAVPAVMAKQPDSGQKSAYEAVLFFDVLSPDAMNCLRLMDGLPDLFPKHRIKVTALARNGKDAVQGALRTFRPELLTVYANNADGTAFAAVASTEVLLPVAMILSGDKKKILWKGAPSDLEDVMKRIASGTFSREKQVQLDMLRNDLQAAVQAGLPRVIMNTAEKILEQEPADTIAVQAKLYVLEGQQRPDLAKAFLKEQIRKAPQEVKLRLVLLNLLTVNAADRSAFQEEVKQALEFFKYDDSEIARILAFVLNNAPFGWIPLKEAEISTAIWDSQGSLPSKRVQAYQAEIKARLAYLAMNIEDAVRYQQQAVALSGSEPAKAMLEYYQSVRTMMQMQKQKP